MVAQPLGPAALLTLAVLFTLALLISLFAPRLWRKGCRRTWRWFARTSADGPCYRCCCCCLRGSVGRLTQKPPNAPTELRARAITSQNATLAWKHEASSVLSDDTFELEVRPEQQGEDDDEGAEGGGEWLSIYSGKATSHREKTFGPDQAYAARVRTVNRAGSSEWSALAESFVTRQIPFKNGGLGPRLSDAVVDAKAPPLFGEQLSARSYTWSQTDDEVSVELACPAGCRGRELLVEFKPTSISVTHKPSGAQLLHGPLYANVKHNECTWDLDADEGVLSIVLEKSLKAESIALSGKERWSCVVVGHPQIDINVDGDEPDKPSVQEIMSKHLNK